MINKNFTTGEVERVSQEAQRSFWRLEVNPLNTAYSLSKLKDHA
jgi:hypothetical protein